jgi:sterol desaturase/sphingolipid hydroxylase (fatty acid hydroxylase superfamily)
MESLPRELIWIPVVVLLCSLIEAVVLSLRGRYDWRAAAVSVADLVVRNLMRFALPVGVAAASLQWLWQHRLFTIALDNALAFALLFIGQEFCYYWYHRAAHRVRFFWATHAVHHSPNDLTLAAAYRLSWTGSLSGSVLFFAPLVWLGFKPLLVLAVVALNLLYQFWIHATWIPKLGFLEHVLNTPSAHRVHHASNLEYLDGNYGGVLIVFDKLFGTYIPERADITIRYGWVKPIGGYNLLKIEFTQWIELARDVWHAPSLMQKFRHLFKPPGWQPVGGETTEDLRAHAASAAALPTQHLPA